MKDELRQIQKRTVQYWFSDGLYEMAFGIICLILALYLLAQALLPKGTLLYSILVSSFVILIMGSSLVINRLMRTIKSRLTYPRTGYIAYKAKPNRSRLISVLLGMAIASIMSFLVVRELISISMMPALTGLVFALVMLFLGLRTGLARFPWIGFIALVVGGGLSLAGIGDNLGLSIFYALNGLTFIFSGVCTLRSYLQHTPAPEETSDGE